ncbi:MAG: SEC-C metal-binding domain-containing protein [Gemmataceae bacterium]
MSQRIFPDVTCPCGSGRKFANCCSGRCFGDEASDDLGTLLDYQRRAFVRKNGREPQLDDLVFFDVPEPPQPPQPPSTWERISNRIKIIAIWILCICILFPGVLLASPLYFRHRGTHKEEVFWWAAFIFGAWALAIAFAVFVVWGLWFLFTRP